MQLNGLALTPGTRVRRNHLRDQGVTNCQQEKHEGMHCMFKPVMISSWIHNYAYKVSSLCCPQSLLPTPLVVTARSHEKSSVSI